MAANKTRKIEDPSDLGGPEKAAVILLALGDEQRKLWEQMDDEEIRVVSQAMVRLGNVTAAAVEKLILEFVGSMSSTGSMRSMRITTSRAKSSGRAASTRAAWSGFTFDSTTATVCGYSFLR